MLEDTKLIQCGSLHTGSKVRFKEKPKVSFMDLIALPKSIHPMGPEAQVEGSGWGRGHGRGHGCGCGQGRGRGGQLPNQLLTSLETITFIKEAAAKQTQKENKLEVKQEFVKVTLKQKARQKRKWRRQESYRLNKFKVEN